MCPPLTVVNLIFFGIILLHFIIKDDTFLPVNLIHWEDDIIIDGEQAKEKVIK
jgi:hypothetical protein